MSDQLILKSMTLKFPIVLNLICFQLVGQYCSCNEGRR